MTLEEKIKATEELTGLTNYNTNNNGKGLTIVKNNTKHNAYIFSKNEANKRLSIYENGHIGYRDGFGLYQTSHEDYSPYTPLPLKWLKPLADIWGDE